MHTGRTPIEQRSSAFVHNQACLSELKAVESLTKFGFVCYGPILTVSPDFDFLAYYPNNGRTLRVSVKSSVYFDDKRGSFRVHLCVRSSGKAVKAFDNRSVDLLGVYLPTTGIICWFDATGLKNRHTLRLAETGSSSKYSTEHQNLISENCRLDLVLEKIFSRPS